MPQVDVIEALDSSTIQHGTYNDRIYLMKLAPEDAGVMAARLLDMARERGYSKVFAKVHEWAEAEFLNAGYLREAAIPRFYHGEETACFVSCFLDKARSVSRTPERNEEVLAACRAKARTFKGATLDSAFDLKACTESDVPAMAELYREVFKTYPFPIHDEAYLLETMRTHVIYFGIWEGERLVALSSAEMDEDVRNVEMTDFATLPRYRGYSFATILLDFMEERMAARGIPTAYTIARAPSFGMNITFARLGYDFGGRLVNNTNISGRFEDMNIWFKPLAAAQGPDASKG
jgi:putative beta-lysine N-acetyltransferase